MVCQASTFCDFNENLITHLKEKIQSFLVFKIRGYLFFFFLELYGRTSENV